LPNGYALQAVNLLYQSLLTVNGPARQFEPLLAASLPTVERADSLTYLHYRLRPEATWDNGQPVTGRDVLFTLKVLACPGLPNESTGSAVSFIQDVRLDPTDPQKFTMVCQGYAPEYPVVSGDFAVLPEYLLDPGNLLQRVSLPVLMRKDSSVANLSAVKAFQERFNSPQQWRDPRRLRGSGPYQLESWESGQRLTLARKSQWWADKLTNPTWGLNAQPRRLEFHIVPNAATALLALRRGELDVYAQPSSVEFEQLRRSGPEKYNFFSPPSYRVVVMEVNTRQRTLGDAYTRQALARLLNTEQLVRTTQYGQGQRSTGIINPRERWAYHDSLPLISYAPEVAVERLRQAGWRRFGGGWSRSRDGQTQQLAPRLFYAAGDRTYETIALAFQQAAKQIGLPVSLHPTEAKALSGLRRQGEFDLSLRTLYGNPFAYDLRPLLHTRSVGEGGVNRTGFGDASSDQLLESIVTTADSTKKALLLHKLQTKLYQEMPLIPIYFEPNRLIVAKRFVNVKASGLEPGYDLQSFTMEKLARQ
jgi:peptide/nickel transport system substrate-binding protein